MLPLHPTRLPEPPHLGFPASSLGVAGPGESEELDGEGGARLGAGPDGGRGGVLVVGGAGSDDGRGRAYGWGGAPCLVGGVRLPSPQVASIFAAPLFRPPRDARPLHLPPGAGYGVTVAAFQRLVASAAPEPAMSGPNMGMPVVPSTEDEDDSFGEAGDAGGLLRGRCYLRVPSWGGGRPA